jgi:hypothetical protein
MSVVKKSGRSRLAESEKSAYIAEGLTLRVATKGMSRRANVSGVPPKPQFLLLKPGDVLILTRSLEPGRGCARSGDLGHPSTGIASQDGNALAL